MKDLKPKHRLFVAEYLKDHNATQAAIRAGYSEKSAASIGEELLRKPEIRDAVDRALAKVEDKAIVDAAYIATAAKEVVTRSLQREPVMYFDKVDKEMKQEEVKVPCDCGDPACKGTRSEGVWKFDGQAANGALKILAAHVRGFNAPTRAEVTGENGKPLVPAAPVIDFSKFTPAMLRKLIEATE